MNFKKWVKSKQTAGYNGAGTVYLFEGRSKEVFDDTAECLEQFRKEKEFCKSKT